jgi:tetratricopeptide (TPR) repeat protein
MIRKSLDSLLRGYKSRETLRPLSIACTNIIQRASTNTLSNNNRIPGTSSCERRFTTAIFMDELFTVEEEKLSVNTNLNKCTLADYASAIQKAICEAEFITARRLLEQIEDFLNYDWVNVESLEEERELISWKMFTARQLAGVYHQIGDDNLAMKQCDKVFGLEKDCKRLGLLEDSFCELNFVCAVKAEIYANRGELQKALKWQNFLIDQRLRKRLCFPIRDLNLRHLLKKTLDLELATRGKIHFALGNLSEALKDFTEALQTSEIDPSTLLLKARVYYLLSEYSLALRDARECLSISSNDHTQKLARDVIDECLKAQKNYTSIQHYRV